MDNDVVREGKKTEYLFPKAYMKNWASIIDVKPMQTKFLFVRSAGRCPSLGSYALTGLMPQSPVRA